MASDLHSNRLAGGCQCGAVRYEIRGEPVSLYVCQCRECQKQSASAFGISVIVKRSALRVIQGEVKVWSRATDSGGTLACAFCPVCGSRVWHEAAGATSVKGGSLDEPPNLRCPDQNGAQAAGRGHPRNRQAIPRQTGLILSGTWNRDEKKRPVAGSGSDHPVSVSYLVLGTRTGSESRRSPSPIPRPARRSGMATRG